MILTSLSLLCRVDEGRHFAQWIVDPRNPLTARVAVNHLWTRHFGVSLTPSLFDMGRKYPEPIHRDLLDWLAAEWMDNHWDMKHMHRLIVNSAAYRRTSSTKQGESNLKIDPENAGYWKRNILRLEAEVIRDSILWLAQSLDPTMGGPPVASKEQSQSRRRSLYFFHSNNDRNLFLSTFDEALVKECYRREESIVPQQALALTNSSLVLDNAKQIAKALENKAQSKGGLDDNAFIREAFRFLLGTSPKPAEVAYTKKILQAWREETMQDGWNDRAMLVWTLLNHNDFVSLR